jgi:anaerobic selenocysteine-containing dehydrogenase
VPAGQIREAARVLGQAGRLLSTVLQGVYQSNQATAAACQVNNLHLLRGMLGRPGCGVLQMNGQPTAQNTRECGADGDLPGFRNWHNPAHVDELARLWNVDRMTIPHWAPPTHAMQIWRYAEQGSIGLLWISGTNPAVSLPELARVRAILEATEPFVVVQDAFLTETARLADVVLPAALWGEKTGTFTNADRTVHLSERAVDPPGEARSDLDIWLDYAARMGFRDRDGEPLVGWSDPEGAFEAWKACSRGRPCDYSGLSYDRLRDAGGVQWPCTATAPGGTERLYADGRFPTDPRSARTTATTWPPGPSRVPRSTGRSSPAAGPSCGRPTTSRPPRAPTTTTRCSSSPAAASTTPHADQDRPGARASAGGPRRLGGAVGRRRGRPWRGRRRLGAGRVEPGGDRGRDPGHRDRSGDGIRPLPLRAPGGQ